MSNKMKDMDIKNRTYYFFDDIINIKIFDLNEIKIDEKSYKNILIYYIGYVTIKNSKYVKINSVNLLYLIITTVPSIPMRLATFRKDAFVIILNVKVNIYTCLNTIKPEGLFLLVVNFNLNHF